MEKTITTFEKTTETGFVYKYKRFYPDVKTAMMTDNMTDSDFTIAKADKPIEKRLEFLRLEQSVFYPFIERYFIPEHLASKGINTNFREIAMSINSQQEFDEKMRQDASKLNIRIPN